MHTIYAHKFHDGEVVLYADKLAMRRLAKFSRDASNKPDKRYKYVTLNCWRYKLEWL